MMVIILKNSKSFPHNFILKFHHALYTNSCIFGSGLGIAGLIGPGTEPCGCC